MTTDAGKSTLSGAIADLLRESGSANAVIDLDDLIMVYPHPRAVSLEGEPARALVLTGIRSSTG